MGEVCAENVDSDYLVCNVCCYESIWLTEMDILELFDLIHTYEISLSEINEMRSSILALYIHY